MKGKFIVNAGALAALAPAIIAGPHIDIQLPVPEVIIKPRERVVVVRPETPPPVVVETAPVVYEPEHHEEHWEDRHDFPKHKAGKGEKRKEKKNKHPNRGAHGIDIPKGHLPPPGHARIWYPGVEPGHQPPPGQYGELAHRVPVGAWLISRENPEMASVAIYDPQRPGVVVDVQWLRCR